MPLPADPVVTAESVIAWSSLGSNVDTTSLIDIVAAVDEFVRGIPAVVVFVTLPDPVPDPFEWPRRYVVGARMLAARLYRRRNSAEGVASFASEGVLYVRRNDPDIVSLLRLNFETVS
jgi:hypothetical protein